MSLLKTDYQQPSLIENSIRALRTAFEDGIIGIALLFVLIYEIGRDVTVTLVHHIQQARKL